MIPEEKYKGIYNPKSNRLQEFDYSSEGGYFITICTKDREYYFGEIVNGEMILNDIGKMVKKYYLEIPNHFSFVVLDEFIIMPNHIHGIIFINNPRRDVALQHLETTNHEQHLENTNFTKPLEKNNIMGNKQGDVALQHLYGNHEQNYKISEKYYSNISPKKGSLSSVIRSFKSICTKSINQNQDKIYFSWQPNYYDRIIRNEDELQKIRQYIFNNPMKWELDKNNTENIFM